MTQLLPLKKEPKRSPAWIFCRGVAILLISGFAAAALVRLAPGFGIDERTLDPRLSAHTLKVIEREHFSERNPVTFYIHFLVRLLRGDAGRSVIFAQPVGDLIRERAPRTLQTVTAGLAYGWSAAVLLVAAATLSRRVSTTLAAMAVSGTLLSMPSAVLAAVCLLLRLSPAIAIAAVIFPRIFPNAYELLKASMTLPHVVTARARGVPATRLFLIHAVPAALMPLIALAAVSETLAFGASIPVEALAHSPGLGQLA